MSNNKKQKCYMLTVIIAPPPPKKVVTTKALVLAYGPGQATRHWKKRLMPLWLKQYDFLRENHFNIICKEWGDSVLDATND